jgi:hypothetical protein
VVGTLDADDFSSFEVTFRADPETAEIPLLIEYRDDDGNRYTATLTVDLSGMTAIPARSSDTMPGTALIVVILVAVGIIGAIIYSWKRT